MTKVWKTENPADWQLDAVLCCVHEGENVLDANPELLKAFPWLLKTALMDVRGEKEEISIIYAPENAEAAPRIVFAGLGKRDDLTLDGLRRAVSAGVRRAKALKLQSVGLFVPAFERLQPKRADHALRPLEEAVVSAKLSLYSYDALKSKKDDQIADPEIFLAPVATPSAELKDFVKRALLAAEAVCFARNMVNTPANLFGPDQMEEAALAFAARHPEVQSTVVDHHGLQSEGMGAFLAVGQGSPRTPRLICLDYCPAGCENEQPLVLVGKGLCFDSGGISLKPAAGMHEMKGDMGGAAAVLGAMQLVAGLGMKKRVVGLLACAENMPDGKATRPGDVVTTMSGKTVEILNTDAEGRLVLCDTLTYAQKYYDPKLMIDVATLTGACVIALGDHAAGLFTQDRHLAATFTELGEVVGEPYWPMPLWESYKEPLKSDSADLGNIGLREGGAIFAALFLEAFVEPGKAWMHLDIAGPSYLSKRTVLNPAGGTGFAVRTLVEYIRNC